jgi:hypothetical protein
MRLSAFLVIATVIISASSLRADESAKPPASNPSSSANPDANGPAKFYGTISAVDASAKTFTIDNQVYTVVGETHMTKAADDSQATMDDAKVGEVARGTYTKGADGKLNVTKVRFGKKTGGGKSGGKSGGKKKGDAASTQPKEKE